MKRLLTLLLFAFVATIGYGQTVVPDLPVGTVPFGNQYWRAPNGDIWTGSSFNGYTNLGNWVRVADSLGLKINYADTTLLIATKQDLRDLPEPNYPVESVTGTLVDNTDPKNPVINTPTAADVGALAPGDNVSELTNDAGYLTTESDPVYSGDPAAGITTTDINNWNAKQNAITGAATTIDTENLTISRALISNGSGKVAVSPVSSTELAFLDGVTSNVQTQLNAKVDDSEVGATNGVAPIGADGKVPSQYLPESGSYKGAWDASTNTPTIADGVGANGDWYRVSVSGTQDLGSGPINFVSGDQVVYNGTVWQRVPSGITVSSVNGQTGDVVLGKADVGLGNVDNTSDLDKPISNAVQAALDLKLDPSALDNYYTKTQLQTAGQSQVYWRNINGLANNVVMTGDQGGFTPLYGGDLDTITGTNINYVVKASAALNTPSWATTDGIIISSGGSGAGMRQLWFGRLGEVGTRAMASGEYEEWIQLATQGWVAGQNYLTQASLDNYVTLDGTQTITGTKTFNNVVRTSQPATDNVIRNHSYLTVNGSIRWGMGLFGAETGNDAGSTFVLSIYSDAGAYLRNAFSVIRSTGVTDFKADPTVNGNTIWHEGNFTPSNYLQTTSPAGAITQTDIDNWNEAASYSAPETVIPTTVNFTINWQTDIAPGSSETYAELHGNHFVYSAFYDNGSGEVNYSPAVKINRDVNGDITTVQFVDIQTGGIVIK